MIDQHAKAGRPEGCLDRHSPIPFSANAWNTRSAAAGSAIPNMTEKPFMAFVAVCRRIGTHQDRFADDESGMQDFAAPFSRHLLRHWRALMGNHGFDLSAEALLVLNVRYALSCVPKLFSSEMGR